MSNYFQIEAAGAAITLNDEDAALIVYGDWGLKEQKVSFDGPNGDSHSAQIISRKVGGSNIYAAIFPRIEMLAASTSFNIEVYCISANPSRVNCTLYKANITEIHLHGGSNYVSTSNEI